MRSLLIILAIICIIAYILYAYNSDDSKGRRAKCGSENKNEHYIPDITRNIAKTNNELIKERTIDVEQGYNKDNNNVNNPNDPNHTLDDEYDNESDNESEFDNAVENKDTLQVDDNYVTFDDFPKSTQKFIDKKFVTRNSSKNGKRVNSYNKGKRGGVDENAVDFIDKSNEIIDNGYVVNDQFVGQDEAETKYAPYKQEKKPTNKYKSSEIFNSRALLPDEKSNNPDWFDVLPEAISVKNRHLINVSKSIGINTIGSSLRNPSYDIRGSPPNPKFVISPWGQSTIEPDNNFTSLC